MRKSQKYILIFLLLFIAVSVVIGKYYEDWNADKIVSAAQMESYGKTYLRKYKYLVHNKVLPAYQEYFSFLQDKSFLIKASISNSHGAAVEFIPSEAQKFQCQTIKNRIEQGIFSGKNLNTSSAVEILGKHCFIKNISLTCEMGVPIKVSDNGSFRTKNIIVNDINYTNIIIIKGSNRRSDWNRKAAKEDALNDFRVDLHDSYSHSEELREFVAMPELTNIAKEIIAKESAGAYRIEHGYLIFQDDLAKLNAAADAHDIKHDFAKSIYTFLKGQPSWRERHWIIFPLMFTFLGVFLGVFLTPVAKAMADRFCRNVKRNKPAE
jgi:cytoskeletal protein CcmA (bactofilin family)